MKLSLATMGVLAIGLHASPAITFQGTISGQITSAHDASFIEFGHNVPVSVGDPIVGYYSIVDVPHGGTELYFTLSVDSKFTLSLHAMWFTINGGQLTDLAYFNNG